MEVPKFDLYGVLWPMEVNGRPQYTALTSATDVRSSSLIWIFFNHPSRNPDAFSSKAHRHSTPKKPSSWETIRHPFFVLALLVSGGGEAVRFREAYLIPLPFHSTRQVQMVWWADGHRWLYLWNPQLCQFGVLVVQRTRLFCHRWVYEMCVKFVTVPDYILF